MKRLLFTLVLACLAAVGLSQDIIVTPSHMNGWNAGTFSPNNTTTATWMIGDKSPYPQIGNGDLWFYSGFTDGIAYADTGLCNGKPLRDLVRVLYSTYTVADPGGIASTSIKNVAPTMNIRIKTGGEKVWLEFSPGLNGDVPKNRWVTWSPLQGKWWSSKNGGSDLRYLLDWLTVYPDAIIDGIRIQAGTWNHAGTNDWNDMWFGVDMPLFATTLGPTTQYNFEPDPLPGQNPVPVPIGPKIAPIASGDGVPFVISPIIIQYPIYYIYEGNPVGENPVKPDAPAIKPDDPWDAADGYYIPLTFDGNSTIKKVLSRIPGVGDPDFKISSGGAFMFGKVPFYIPREGNNSWDADAYQDNDTHKLVVKANLDGVTEVHTIINTSSGTNDKGVFFIEFRGSKGALYIAELVENQTVRDWHKWNYNKIVAPTQNVWLKPITTHKGHPDCEVRLDSQVFKLPAEFANQTLQSITAVDKGKHNVQRLFIVGVTVKVKKGKS